MGNKKKKVCMICDKTIVQDGTETDNHFYEMNVNMVETASPEKSIILTKTHYFCGTCGTKRMSGSVLGYLFAD